MSKPEMDYEKAKQTVWEGWGYGSHSAMNTEADYREAKGFLKGFSAGEIAMKEREKVMAELLARSRYLYEPIGAYNPKKEQTLFEEWRQDVERTLAKLASEQSDRSAATGDTHAQ